MKPSGLTRAGLPVHSGGEFPVSIAFNEKVRFTSHSRTYHPAKGTLLCALNGGKVSGVLCYSVHPTRGLTVISNTQRTLYLNQTTPATGPPGTVSTSTISFSDDGKHLIAVIKGTAPTSQYLAVWDLTITTASLLISYRLQLPMAG